MMTKDIDMVCGAAASKLKDDIRWLVKCDNTTNLNLQAEYSKQKPELLSFYS